jgi:murein L,D-transpeptidase YcbB/YkuD
MSNHFRLVMWQGSLKKLGIVLICMTAAIFTAQSYADDADDTANYAAKNYQRLKAILPYYQQAAAQPQNYTWPVMPQTEKPLHPGSRDGMVLLLRQRLKTTHDLAADSANSMTFDDELADAVKVFQNRHGLTADAIVGQDTLAALNVQPAARVRQIQLNMQRWAELARTAGNRYVLVNIPEYRLHLIDKNHEVLTMKVIVGRPSRQTPELVSDITRIVFNPKWNVPNMIAQNDIVPKMIMNRNYLNQNQIRIFNNQESDAQEMSAYDVDWKGAEDNGFQYHLRQEPGIKNALGLVKFEFENTHDVYLHDTPAKELFNRDQRDFSSGCMRVEKPFALVGYLTNDDERMNSDKMRGILATKRTTYFRVQHPITIITTYITAWVDDGGMVHFANDVYEKDNDPSLVPREQDSNGEDRHRG